MSPRSPSSQCDDYVIVQPHRWQNLPLRTKTSQQPTTHHDSHPVSGDEYDCVSSPDSIRSLNSTPPASSPFPPATAFEQARCSEYEPVSPFELDFSALTSSDFISKTSESSKPIPANHATYASHTTNSHSFVPTSPAIKAPYVYTAPSEEGYPGTGVLRPTASAMLDFYPRPATYSPSISKTHAMQDPEQYGHRQIDIVIMDRLIEHACEFRLKADLRTPASRDAILRYQMMKRLLELSSNHPVIHKASFHSPLPCRPPQLRWTSSERIKAYRDILTDSEKLALWYLSLTHGKHLHTECIFEDFAETVRDLPLTASLIVDARQVALTVQIASSSNANLDAIFHDKDLVYSTRLQVLAKAEENHKIYDEMINGADSSDADVSSRHYRPNIPGTFETPFPSSKQVTNSNSQSDFTPTTYFRRMAIKDILCQSLTDPMLPMPIKRKSLAAQPAPQPLSILPSGITMDQRALQDYQMQLMLLEQQNRKRYACSGARLCGGSTVVNTPNADVAAITSTSSHNSLAPTLAPAPQPMDYQAQLELLEQQCKKRHMMAAVEAGTEPEQRRNKYSRTEQGDLRGAR